MKLKTIDIGQTVQIIANIGVIIGILLVAVQLRQNNELLGVQIRADALERRLGTIDALLGNPDLFELLAKHESTLSPIERDRLTVMGIRVLSTFESSFESVVHGLEDEERLRRAVRALWNRPRLNYGMPIAWDTFKERASPDFVAWMEANVLDAQ